MRKWAVISGVGVLVVAAVTYFLFARSTSAKYDFRLDKVSQGSVSVVVTATGTINAVTSVDVGTQVSGIISKLYADYNSVVKAGQVIAQIDSTFLSQSVKDAEASLERAAAQVEQSRRAYFRTKSLFDRGLESQTNFDLAYTQYLSDSAAMKSAKASLDRAKINLAYSTIYAPISGVVINRAVNVGQTVAASFSSPTLYTIANDLKKMQVEATVDESDIGQVAVGQEATFTVDAYPDQQFTGVVSKIRLNPVTIQNVVNYTVVISVNNDQLKLMPGMTANVRIQVASDNTALRVPNMALRFQPPADLVDSAAIKAQRAAFSGAGGVDPAGGPGGGRRGGFGGGFGGNPAMQERFQAIRDSIQKAHGGSLSPGDLRSEMRAAFQRMGGGASQAPEAVIVPPSAKSKNTGAFGITDIYPEYQKSASAAADQAGMGRIWIMAANGKLQPIFVRTGLNDGRFTEIKTTALKDGDQIVLGVLSNSDNGTEQTRSPFSGQNQRGGPGFIR